MLFLADECCDSLIVKTLRYLGHDVLYIAELTPGSKDVDVLAQSVDQERVLVTEDRDFGELVFRRNGAAFGIVLFRIPTSERYTKEQRMTEVVERHQHELRDAMTIVSVNNIRIRPLPTSR